jgi:hypothetical protein
LTPYWVIGTFFLVGCVFVPIGVVILIASGDVSEVRVDYSAAATCKKFEENDENCAYKNCAQQSRECTVDFKVDADMKGEVYVYYELENFYQNHRRYFKSRSDTQLRGDEKALPDAGDKGVLSSDPPITECDPESSRFTHVNEKLFETPGGATNRDEDCNKQDLDTTSEAYKKNCMKVFYYPCGLIALSQFNDKFKIERKDGDTRQTIKWRNNKIAWQSDLDSKFKLRGDSCAWMEKNCLNKVTCNAEKAPEITNMCISGVDQATGNPIYGACTNKASRVSDQALEPSLDSGFNAAGKVFKEFSPGKSGYYCWQDVQDPDFIVWMRTAGLPTFKKLHRIIDENQMKAGEYTLTILSRYNVAAFNGKKSLVLSTVSWVGGKNTFLGGAYVVVGALCLLLGTAFLAKHLISPRQLGDTKYLVWKQ